MRKYDKILVAKEQRLLPSVLRKFLAIVKHVLVMQTNLLFIITLRQNINSHQTTMA